MGKLVTLISVVAFSLLILVFVVEVVVYLSSYQLLSQLRSSERYLSSRVAMSKREVSKLLSSGKILIIHGCLESYENNSGELTLSLSLTDGKLRVHISNLNDELANSLMDTLRASRGDDITVTLKVVGEWNGEEVHGAPISGAIVISAGDVRALQDEYNRKLNLLRELLNIILAMAAATLLLLIISLWWLRRFVNTVKKMLSEARREMALLTERLSN